jgi:hypothetical protein
VAPRSTYYRVDNDLEEDRARTQRLVEHANSGTVFIKPGSPWHDPFVESFYSRMCDDLLDVQECSCLTEAGVVIGDWHLDYTRAGHTARSRCWPRPPAPPSGPTMTQRSRLNLRGCRRHAARPSRSVLATLAPSQRRSRDYVKPSSRSVGHRRYLPTRHMRHLSLVDRKRGPISAVPARTAKLLLTTTLLA